MSVCQVNRMLARWVVVLLNSCVYLFLNQNVSGYPVSVIALLMVRIVSRNDTKHNMRC